MEEKKLVTILVPAYNEQEVLYMLYDRLKKLMDENSKYDFEILLVNDGSKDDSLKIMQELREKDKRVNYLNEIIKELKLKDIKAIHIRAEDYHETFDIVTARAVANIEKLLKYTMHLLKPKGKLVAMKGNIEEGLLFCGAKAWKAQKIDTVREAVQELFA